MFSLSTQNRRWAGWLLTLAFVFMTLPAHFGWQCLDGTPCPVKCPMGRNVSSPTTAQIKPAESECMRCHSASNAIVVTPPASETLSTMTCVLKADTQPVVTLVERTHFILPLLALPPPQREPVVVSVSTPLTLPETLFFLPQRFLRPQSGRAPPIHLG
jgi:hypothetical protein